MNNISVFKDITKQEQFERNMKNVLEIEKKNAVKEFAEKLRKKVISLNVWEFGEIDIIDVDDIDELLKEDEG